MSVDSITINGATLYYGEALAVLQSLPSASVDALITDPPYSSGGMVRGDRVMGVHAKYVTTDSGSGNALAGFGGDTRDARSYGYWMALWLSECLRVVRPGGVAALFTDWRQLPVTCDQLQAGGFVWRGIVPWNKPGSRPTQGRWANSCEYVVWGTNGPRSLDELDGQTLPGFFDEATPRDRDHITQKPVGVMRALVRIVPRDAVVLDLFMGSGTTGVACVLEGRRFIGAEMTRHHFDTACRRIREAGLQGDLLSHKAVPAGVQLEIE